MATTILKWSEEIGLYSFPWRNNNKCSQISKSKQRCDYIKKFESNINKYICIIHCWIPITNIYEYFLQIIQFYMETQFLRVTRQMENYQKLKWLPGMSLDLE